MFTQLGAWLGGFLTSYVSTVVSTICLALAPLALILLTIYIANYGLAVMRGEVDEPMGVFAWKMVKMGVILSVALGPGLYMTAVFDAINGVQDSMATVFVSAGLGPGVASAATAFGALDVVNERAYTVAADMWLAGGLSRLDLYIAAIVYSLGVCIFMVIAAAVVLMAKMFMAFALAIGPAAVLCLMFKVTAKFFDAWLSVAMSAAVLAWFAFFGLGLALFVGNDILTQIDSTGAFKEAAGSVTPIKAALTALVLYVLLAILMWQAPSLASALTGGPAMRSGAGMAMSYAMGRSGSRGGGTGSSSSSASGSGGNRITGGATAATGAGSTAATGMAYQKVPRLFSGGRR